MANAPRVQVDGDKAIPVLDRQPLLPKTAPVRMVNHDETCNEERALVQIMTSLEEPIYIPKEGSSEIGKGPIVTFQDG